MQLVLQSPLITLQSLTLYYFPSWQNYEIAKATPTELVWNSIFTESQLKFITGKK